VFEFLLHVAIMACLYGMLALSLNLQVGFAGLINFGQIVLFGAGAYGAALAFANGFGPVAGLALGVAFSTAIAVAFAQLGRNLGADYWGIATLAVAEVLRILITNEVDLTGGAQGIAGIPLIFGDWPRPAGPLMTLGLCVAILLAAWWFCNRLTESRFGLALKLIREEPMLALSLGYDLNVARTATLVVAGAMAALSGFVFAHYVTFVGPDQLVAAETFLIWAMVIIGGSGNHLGAIVGAILMQFLFAFVPFVKDALGAPAEYVAAMRLTLVGGGLLAFLMWRTQGLVPERVGGTRPAPARDRPAAARMVEKHNV
jgi:branched-chain amino acid transport system permease protein